MRAQNVGTSGRRKAGEASGADARFNAARFFLSRDNIGKILAAKKIAIDRRLGNIDVQIPAATPKRIDGPKSGTYFGWIYGIGTYSAPLSVATQGNYGDIIGVDLQELVTKKILGLENTPLADWNPAQLAAYGEQLNKLGNFSIDQSVIDSFTAKEGASLPPMQLVTKEAKGIEVYSRMYTNGPTPAEFKDSGVLYLAPTITEQDETNLRAGKKIDTKPAVTISFWYGEKNAAGVFEKKQGTVSVTANDIKQVQTFFGDRPLDNPGYSKFELKGEVKADSTSNDVLDVFRVEQRLKYLGFPAMGHNAITTTSSAPVNGVANTVTLTQNSLQDFTVDGQFGEQEKAALKLFEKVVRYTDSATASGNSTATIKSADGHARVSVVVILEADGADGRTVTNRWVTTTWAEPVITNKKISAEQKTAAIAALKAMETSAEGLQAIEKATLAAQAIATAGVDTAADKSTKFNSDYAGADGMIEADQNDKWAKLTTGWLSAYNAPHWMQLFESTSGGQFAASDTTNLPGWENKQRGNHPADSPTNVENYGTSWLRDLMAAKQFAPTSLVQSGSWFNGATDANGVVSQVVHHTHDLGMAFDLGVSNFIEKNGDQTRTSDPGNNQKAAEIILLPDVSWSVAKAEEYANYLVNSMLPDPLNNQRAALKDFLSLFAITRSDTAAGSGTWDFLPVKNGEAVRAALFGTGQADGGLISAVHIGSLDKYGNTISGQNPYPSINAILDKLGINATPIRDHQSHFHVYLRPPELLEIEIASHLLADAQPASLEVTPETTAQTDAQGLLDYAQTLIEGEELMFTMDVPTIPAQETTIVLAQANTSSARPQPDYILKICTETESTGNPMSAMRGVNPAGWLAAYIENHLQRQIDRATEATIKITLLEGTTHGKLNPLTTGDGRLYYMYDPIPEYVGNDRAVFLAEFEGKVYKIIVDLHVFITVGENDPSATSCPAPQLIKVKKPATPSSGANGYDLNAPTSTSSAQALTSLVAGITVTFADLEGAAIGQTTSTTITLDTNAAGNNWFIDPTPGQNEEYLPTSNPNEWVAKAGSAAAGKMDMLSVLLHEYGHALGINHSADPNDYMGTTLTAGVRRLPSAEEMALMQGLVAQAKAKATLSPSPSPASGGGEFPTLPLGTTFIGFLGLLRSSRYGGVSIVPDESTLTLPMNFTLL